MNEIEFCQHWAGKLTEEQIKLVTHYAKKCQFVGVGREVGRITQLPIAVLNAGSTTFHAIEPTGECFVASKEGITYYNIEYKQERVYRKELEKGVNWNKHFYTGVLESYRTREKELQKIIPVIKTNFEEDYLRLLDDFSVFEDLLFELEKELRHAGKERAVNCIAIADKIKRTLSGE